MKKRIVVSLLLIMLLGIGLVVGRSFWLSSNECMDTDVIAIPSNIGKAHPNQEVSPLFSNDIPQWWGIQPNWWMPFQVNLDSFETPYTIRARDGIVWVDLSSRVLKYNTITGTSKFYKLLDNDRTPYNFWDVLFTKDGNLWALGASNGENSSFVLAGYNKKSDQFEIVPELTRKKDNGSNFGITSQMLAETNDGKLLLPLEQNIISYDYHQHTSQRLLPSGFSKNVAALVVSDQKVWFTIQQDRDVRSVDLETGELINYGHISGLTDESPWKYEHLDGYHSLAVDRQGNVWIGSLAKLRLNPNGTYTWEKLPYPREFVYERVVNPYDDNPQYAYDLADIYGVDVFRDGSLWFNSSSGIVQYNPVKNTWCKRAKMLKVPSVTDDGQGNLWLAVIRDQHLNIYKKELKP